MGCPSECSRAKRPVDPAQPVRLPGDAVARGIERAGREGIGHAPETVRALQAAALSLPVNLPSGLALDAVG